MKKVIIIFGIILLILFSLVQWNKRESLPDFLDEEFVEIEQLFEKRNNSNTKVSEANVAWHLDHLLKTINQVSKKLMNSDPENFNSNFSAQRTFVHTSGIIPRGVAQSPENVRPPEVILLDSLKIQLKEAKINVEKITNLDEKANFEHPVFNQLDRDQTRRFLDVHTNHHLKIIRDILEQ
jgi:hypothetical protein